MRKRLKDNLSSDYLEAANRLNSKKSRRRIVAYVESYDDIFFWRTVLNTFENEQRYFEIMLPSHKKLERGKKSVIMSLLKGKTGKDLIACVDADYDYLIRGATATSKTICNSPFIFHTYAYSIENLQCYAPSLHNVCVAVTLNDHSLFNFSEFLRLFSEAIFPLFVWSIWFYRRPIYTDFTISDFNRTIEMSSFNLQKPVECLQHIKDKVTKKVKALERSYPQAAASYKALAKELTEEMGVTPQTTYLYIQGHHLFDKVVVPIMNKVCDSLQRYREQEIRRQSVHSTQMRDELSCYNHSVQEIKAMLRKNVGYATSEPFRRIQADVSTYFQLTEKASTAPSAPQKNKKAKPA